jgi:hypothetical protein
LIWVVVAAYVAVIIAAKIEAKSTKFFIFFYVFVVCRLKLSPRLILEMKGKEAFMHIGSAKDLFR